MSKKRSDWGKGKEENEEGRLSGAHTREVEERKAADEAQQGVNLNQ